MIPVHMALPPNGDILAGLDRPLKTMVVLISGEANETLAASAQAMGLAALLNKDSTRTQLCERMVEIGDGGFATG
jgi:hypothetical protein